jgi:periplasmic protein CpxP/Spy
VTSRVLVAAALAVACATTAGAQRPRPLRTSAGQGSAQRVPTPGDSGDRARLEGEIRRGFARAVRDRVGLSDAQITKLVPITQKYEQQRRQLLSEERDARQSLRTTMRNEQTADTAQVDRLLRTLVEVQKRRVTLLETEQRDLATIMTPLQRAKFMALQDQIRRRLEQMRQRRMPFDGDPGGPPPRQRPPL